MTSTKAYGMFQSDPDEAATGPIGAGCPVTHAGETFQPFSDGYVQDPYAFFAEMREAEPVFYSPEMDCWVVTKYDDCVRVFRDPETFSPIVARHPVRSLCPAAAEVRDSLDIGIEPSLVDEEADTHKAHRRLFGDAFTPKRVNEVEPRVRAIVTRFIDRIIDAGEAELVSEMLYEIPALAIFIFLGAPDDKALMVKDLGSKRAVVNWGYPTDDEQVAIMKDMGRSWDFTVELVDQALENPGDNYLGDMVRLYREDPSRFSINYLRNVMFLMQFAGHETTTQASANGLKKLLTDREKWEQLVADPSLVPNAVEEILRYDSSIFAWRRMATEDTEIGGMPVPKGGKVLIMMGSGNRDPDMFENPEEFDPARSNAKRHLGLGHGAHFCMGAPLARMEMKVILEELVRRLPHMHLKPDQAFRYFPTLTFRGVQNLEVTWDVSQNP